MLDVIRQYWPDLAKGAGITVLLTFSAMALALLLGLLIALMRAAPSRVMRLGAAVYVDFFRGTPLLLQLFYLYFVLPYAGIRLPALAAGILGLGLNYAAYLSEVYRAAIAAVDHGQREAADALGMSAVTAMRRIILPQAFRIAVPPIGNYFIAMFKDTALVAVISVRDLLFTAEDLANQTYQYLEIFTIVFVVYFAISYPASLFVQRLERRLVRRVRVEPQASETPDLVRAHA
jgi:ectoine/hydroxyectoine ABC transporter permease protein EhuD